MFRYVHCVRVQDFLFERAVNPKGGMRALQFCPFRLTNDCRVRCFALRPCLILYSIIHAVCLRVKVHLVLVNCPRWPGLVVTHAAVEMLRFNVVSVTSFHSKRLLVLTLPRLLSETCSPDADDMFVALDLSYTNEGEIKNNANFSTIITA